MGLFESISKLTHPTEKSGWIETNSQGIRGGSVMYNPFKKKWFKFTYRDWLAYFQRNDKRRLVIDFSEEPELDFKAKDLIFPSIMAFQKGEHSEGYQFTEMAKNFAKDRKEPYYSDAVNLFIREENFHSAYLAEYMNFYGIKKATENSLDKAFRSMRHSRVSLERFRF